MLALQWLKKQLPTLEVSTEAKDLSYYGTDLSAYQGESPLAIAFPKSTEQVVQLVQWANEHNIALVPSGGRTGYSGGAVAHAGEVVVSLIKMNRILQTNSNDASITCEAGVITQTLQQTASTMGWYFPIDFASAGSSTIGGNIATNAGGIHVIRYGMTRQWVSGLEVVTGEGKVLHLNHGLIKNNSGYDLRELMIGSEGTLGIITHATVQLTKADQAQKVILIGLNDLQQIDCLKEKLLKTATINAFEFFTATALDYVINEHDHAKPFDQDYTYYLIVEYAAEGDADQNVMSLLEHVIEKNTDINALISSSEQQKQDLWHYREHISLSLKPFNPTKYDIAVLPSKIMTAISDINQLLENYLETKNIVWFGHAGDGNLHLNILQPENMTADKYNELIEIISPIIYQEIKKQCGTVSAEHGIGTLKKDYLPYCKNEDEVNYMKAIKKVFDPNGILNPGKIFD